MESTKKISILLIERLQTFEQRLCKGYVTPNYSFTSYDNFTGTTFVIFLTMRKSEIHLTEKYCSLVGKETVAYQIPGIFLRWKKECVINLLIWNEVVWVPITLNAANPQTQVHRKSLKKMLKSSLNSEKVKLHSNFDFTLSWKTVSKPMPHSVMMKHTHTWAQILSSALRELEAVDTKAHVIA